MDGDEISEVLPYIATDATSRDREAWLIARRSGIGASEAAALIGASRWADPALVYARKVGLAEESEAAEHLEWGLRHEATILAAYSEPRYSGRPTRSDGRLLRSREYPWALCTLDGWTQHPEHGWIPLEIKTTSERHADSWDEGPPPEYVAQVQWQMMVTGAPMVSVAALIGVHRLVWCDVERDEPQIRRLIAAGADLWDRVERRDPPPTTDLRSLAVLYPRDSGAVVELDASVLDLDAERERLLGEKRALSARLDEIEGEIKARMRDATRAVLPDGTAYTWKVQRRAEHVVKASETRVFRRSAPRER